MCGIAGILNFRPAATDDLGTIRQMVSAIQHRGPDEQGFYLDDHVALGHARLSIIDLAGGTQPIHNEDQRIWTVFNGEIFNYPELRAEMETRGHHFSTQSDTEVIVHLYEEYGERCFEHLLGQFAIAIWDVDRRRLVLGRDRVGIRPLFYSQVAEGLLFASEVKAIAASNKVQLKMDPQVLAQIFTLWTPLPGRSAFTGVQEVPPGCWVSVESGIVRTQRYWQWPCPHPDTYSQQSRGELIEELDALLQDAVRIRMRADVPVGSYVSGGLDSSGISSITKARFNPDLHTFGIRFEESEYDEGIHQDAMVSWLKTDHTALSASNRDIGQAFAECVWHMEQPVIRTAPVPLFLLSRAVRDAGFKVVLTGEGADEVFGGYNIFRETKVRRFWARQPESQSRPLLLKRLYPYVFKDARLAGMMTAFFGKGLDRVDDPYFSHAIRWSNELTNYFSPDLAAGLGDYDPRDEVDACLPAGFHEADWLTRAQALESMLFMSQYLLCAQGDRLAMAHSVEIRLPYLDHRLIEFAARVPPERKIRGMEEKDLLKQTLAAWLPPEIARREKHPYRAPIRESLLAEDALREQISPDRIEEAGLFHPDRVRRLTSKLNASGQAAERDEMALAGIMSSQLLHQQFVAGSYARNTIVEDPALLVDHRSRKDLVQK